MQQLDKWQQELQRLSDRTYKEMDKELYNHYKDALKKLKTEVKGYIDAFDQLSFSQRLEVERRLSIAARIDEILLDMSGQAESVVQNYVQEEAAQGYYGTWYTLEGAENVQLDFSLLPESYIEELVGKNIAGKTFSKRLYQHRDELAERVTQALLDGAVSGKGYAYVAKQVGELTEANYKQALRIARTEGGRVQSTTKQRAYEEAVKKGVELEKVWMSTLDKKTRNSHQELDGQTVEVDEDFTASSGAKGKGPRLFGVAGEDINCRCTTITRVRGLSPSLRLDNESKQAIPYQSYNDWAEGKGYKEASSIQDKVQANGKAVSKEITQLQSIKERLGKEESLKNEIEAIREEIKNGKPATNRKKLLDELERQYEYDEITTAEYNAGLKEIKARFSGDGQGDNTASLRDQLLKKSEELIQVQDTNTYANAEDIKKVLSKYRKMGADEIDLSGHLSNPRSEMTKVVKKAYDYYPADWVKRSVEFGTINVKKVKRGYYSHHEKGSELALSGKVGSHNSFRTALHELGHRQEHIHSDLLEAEKVFYEQRTKGEPLVRLKDVTRGFNYGAKEVTRVDHFIEPYMGKDYGGDAYELFTMAADTLFTNPSQLIEGDPDMLEWVVGVLLTL